MKIGVITHWRASDNYGQQLQVYALQQYLRQMGHEAYLIRYDCLNEKEKTLKFSNIKRMIVSLLRFVSKQRKIAYEEMQKSKRLRLYNAEQNLKRDFETFKQKNLNLSIPYHSYHDLYNNPPEADAYIVGSDQVWNPPIDAQNIGVWYLQFGAKHVKRIAYAASFGREISDKDKEKLSSLLKGLDAISVREKKTQDTLQEIGFGQVKLVLDPTLLVSKEIFLRLVPERQEEQPYVFLYYLNVKSTDQLCWTQIESFLKTQKLGLKSVTASGYYPAQDLIPEHNSLYLTIPQWVQTLSNARYVITTSFHGVALAIVMHRPFVAILLGIELRGGNERILSLLKLLHLEDRILTKSNSVSQILSQPIDWTSVDACLAAERRKSNNFLINALK